MRWRRCCCMFKVVMWCWVCNLQFCFCSFSSLHWRLQNTFVEDSDIDTSWFCGVFSGVVFLFLASLGGVVFDQNRMCQEIAVNTNSLLIYFGKILFSGLHWRLQNIFVEDSDIDTSWFCGVFSGVVFCFWPPSGALFLIKTGCVKKSLWTRIRI